MIGMGIIGILTMALILNIRNPSKVIMIAIILTIVINYCVYNLGAPNFCFYIMDAINVYLVLMMLSKSKTKVRSMYHLTSRAIALFAVAAFISFTVNFSVKSALMYIWGARNYFRFIIFFFACIRFLKVREVRHLFSVMPYVLTISTILSIYQYVILGYRKDYVGGIFGTATSSNAGLNILFIIMCTYYLVIYLNKQIRLMRVLYILMCCFIGAALGEIKFFFFEFFLLIGLAAIKPSFRTIAAVILSTIAVWIGIYIFQSFNRSFNFFDIDTIMHYATDSSYSYTSYSVNRIGGIGKINDIIFTNGYQPLFGVGLGNADRSSFFSSAIYNVFGNMNYTWFLFIFLYLEMGWLGLFAYCSIFVAYFIDVWRLGTEISPNIRRSSLILAVMSLTYIVYNASLRMDIAYLHFAFLALPFMLSLEDSMIDLIPVKRNKFRIVLGRRRLRTGSATVFKGR